MTEHELAVLENQAMSDAQIVDEGEACQHKAQTVVAHYGGMMEDPVSYTRCDRCGSGFVTVYYLASKTYQTRPMSKTETARYA